MPHELTLGERLPLLFTPSFPGENRYRTETARTRGSPAGRSRTAAGKNRTVEGTVGEFRPWFHSRVRWEPCDPRIGRLDFTSTESNQRSSRSRLARRSQAAVPAGRS